MTAHVLVCNLTPRMPERTLSSIFAGYPGFVRAELLPVSADGLRNARAFFATDDDCRHCITHRPAELHRSVSLHLCDETVAVDTRPPTGVPSLVAWNLAPRMTEHTLRQIFAVAPGFVSASLLPQQPSASHRSARIYFKTAEDCRRCIAQRPPELRREVHLEAEPTVDMRSASTRERDQESNGNSTVPTELATASAAVTLPPSRAGTASAAAVLPPERREFRRDSLPAQHSAGPAGSRNYFFDSLWPAEFQDTVERSLGFVVMNLLPGISPPDATAELVVRRMPADATPREVRQCFIGFQGLQEVSLLGIGKDDLRDFAVRFENRQQAHCALLLRQFWNFEGFDDLSPWNIDFLHR